MLFKFGKTRLTDKQPADIGRTFDEFLVEQRKQALHKSGAVDMCNSLQSCKHHPCTHLLKEIIDNGR